NLACNPAVSASDALDYGHRAYDLMQQAHAFESRVADTYGWSLVQTNDSRNIDMGINVLLDAWKADEIPDTAYHLGKAYLAKGNAIEAQKYLDKAMDLYSEALKNDQVFDNTLQQSILDAQSQLKKLKGNRGS
ncbi:MAG TPA: hypothetical protein VHS31_11050, partial [Tepidisphaeraceae bacterium]|nr:hypothetical protein [Tepidisphaeraceae bacterium]